MDFVVPDNNKMLEDLFKFLNKLSQPEISAVRAQHSNMDSAQAEFCTLNRYLNKHFLGEACGWAQPELK